MKNRIIPRSTKLKTVDGSAFAIALGSIPKKAAPRRVPVAKLIKQNIIFWVPLSHNKRIKLPIKNPMLQMRLKTMIQVSKMDVPFYAFLNNFTV